MAKCRETLGSERDQKIEEKVIGSSVGPEAVVEDGATISNSVILEGAKIGADSVLENCLIGIGAKVPEGTELYGEIVDHSVL